MEDYHVAKFVPYQGRELGLFAIYDGHLGDTVPSYLQKHLFSNILKEVITLKNQQLIFTQQFLAIHNSLCFIILYSTCF